MSLFGGLYVGTSGLQTAQNALNTTAHNMTNVDTKGYTRQQVAQSTRSYNTISTTASAISYTQVGLGVSYSDVRQVRDYFLDKAYRKESGREGFYNVASEALEEVEDIFQELDGQAFAESLDNLWVSIEELSKDPSNTVNQGVLVQRCAEFVTRSQSVYQGLVDYQNDLNYDVKQNVQKINDIGERIVELNDQILKIEAGKIEQANDLRDERNRLTDELSQYASISVDTDVDGNFIIKLEGVDFVSADTYKKMGAYPDPVTGLYTPYWVNLALKDSDGNISDISKAHVFDLEQEISTNINTDIGSLKSTLLARGDKKATYEDLADSATYDGIKDSIIMNVMAEFDQLVNKVTEGVNKAIYDAALDYYGDASNFSTGKYLIDANTGEPYKIFDTISDAEGYTTENILINDTLKQSPSLLGFIRPDGKIDNTATDLLKGLFSNEIYTLNPDVKTTTNLNNYYNNLVSQVANTGFVMRGISANQTVTVTNIASAREEILGVSTDEELSNMIMFQNAFNASSRYINAMSEMIEHIINTLGV